MDGPHTANWICNCLLRFFCEVADRPPYSSGLALTDFHLFRPRKKHLADQRFAADANTD